ncbi:uncharacterized protein LOC120886689 [Ictidomys tridecemlineatus]
MRSRVLLKRKKSALSLLLSHFMGHQGCCRPGRLPSPGESPTARPRAAAGDSGGKRILWKFPAHWWDLPLTLSTTDSDCTGDGSATPCRQVTAGTKQLSRAASPQGLRVQAALSWRTLPQDQAGGRAGEVLEPVLGPPRFPPPPCLTMEDWLLSGLWKE